jgi:hypothetical protein
MIEVSRAREEIRGFGRLVNSLKALSFEGPEPGVGAYQRIGGGKNECRR